MQIVSTGLLAQNSSSSPCPAWTADFCAACSAAYLSLQPSMHTSMSQALMGCPTSSVLSRTPLPRTSNGADATADSVTLLVHSQSESDHPVLAASDSARQRHDTDVGKVGQLGRITAAWGVTPKLNSVAPMPLPGPCSSRVQNINMDADAHQLQDCFAPVKNLAETAVALDRCYSLMHMLALRLCYARGFQHNPDQHNLCHPFLMFDRPCRKTSSVCLQNSCRCLM